MTISQSILKLVIPAAEEAGAKRILKIRMRVGELSGIIPSFLDKCFVQMSEGTIAEGAKLEYEMVPALIRCKDCGSEGDIDRKNYCCRECGSLKVKIISGREHLVQDLEVE